MVKAETDDLTSGTLLGDAHHDLEAVSDSSHDTVHSANCYA